MKRILSAILVCSLFIGIPGATGKPVSPDEAVMAARGWLTLTDARPMDKSLGSGLRFMTPGLDSNGKTLYFAVHLEKGGVLVLSSDDALDPVVAFSSDPADLSDTSPCNHLRQLLERDLSAQLQELQADPGAKATAKSSKWELLKAAARDPSGVKAGLASVSSMRVKPLIATRWNQSYVYRGSTRLTCYNYFTPNHYLCGCVATAYAQLMKFYRHPRTGPGTPQFTVYVNGGSLARALRGGNGAGGAYDWANMPNDPAGLARAGQLTLAQRKAIGALCHDAGVAASMSYGLHESSAIFNGHSLLVSFQYVHDGGYGNSALSRRDINNFVNPNLDAGMPCFLSLSGPAGRHAVIVDGYGYAYGTLYHHLNMGWGGSGDAWYKLPKVSSNPSFSSVVNYIYNIWPRGKGGYGICAHGVHAHTLFVVSGRVTQPSGKPLAGVRVTAYLNPQGSSTCTPTNNVSVTTDANGRYVMKVPYGLHWIITPQVAGVGYEPECYDQHCSQWNLNFKRCSRILRISPNPLDFGYLAPNEQAWLPVTLYNDGTSTLTIPETDTIAYWNLSPQPPYTIPPKSNIQISVWYSGNSPLSNEFVFPSNMSKGTNILTITRQSKPPPIYY